MSESWDANSASFGRWVGFWRERWTKRGEDYSGTIEQTRAIEDILKGLLKPRDYYVDAMDFGAGHGRFCEFMSLYCGHIWAADIVSEMLERYASYAPTVTPLKVEWPISFPLKDNKLDLLWSFFTFQHLVDPSLFQQTVQELRRVLKPGARVLIIDNAVDMANHVRVRGPDALGKALGLQAGFSRMRITVSKPQDHWLIDGIKI